MKRRALMGSLLLAVLLASLIVSGCGASAGAGSGAGRRAPVALARRRAVSRPAVLSVRANVRLARRMAVGLLEEVPLPAGARRVSEDESVHSNLGGAEGPGAPVDMHRFWRVEGAPEAVIDWVDAHPPAGSKIVRRGTIGKAISLPSRPLGGKAVPAHVGGQGQTAEGRPRVHTVTTWWETTFAFPPVKERLARVRLSVSVAAAKRGGSEMRADALVVWRKPRTASERIPEGVGEVSVNVSDPRRHIDFARQITSAPVVKAIVGVIEALQRPEGAENAHLVASCPALSGKAAAVIDLRFRRSANALPLVRVRIKDEDEGCGGRVVFYRGGRRQPVLGEVREAVRQLHGILGRQL